MSKSEKFVEFERKEAILKSTRGFKVAKSIEQMKRSLSMVRKNKEQLKTTVDKLTDPAAALTLWEVGNRPLLNAAMDEITRTFHNCISSAFSLIEYLRHYRVAFYQNSTFDKEIQEEVKNRFENDADHHVAKGLRNLSFHEQLVPMVAELRFIEKTGIESSFNLSVPDLLKWDGWDADAKKELQKMSKPISLLDLVDQYFGKIQAFYTWLWSSQEDIEGDEIDKAISLEKDLKDTWDQIGKP